MQPGTEYRLPGLLIRCADRPDLQRDADPSRPLSELLDAQQQQYGKAALQGWRSEASGISRPYDILSAAEQLAGTATELLLIGMGGSINGARAVYRALELSGSIRHPLEFMDNPDPHSMIGLLESVDPERCAVLCVSRSGRTLETLAMLAAALQHLDAGNAATPAVAVCCLDGNNPLGNLADAKQWQRIRLPEDVGGRFGMFTAAGLLPLAVAGIDINALLEAAQSTAQLLESTALPDNPAWQLSGLMLAEGIDNAVLYVYGDLLLGFADWWRQLIAESTGRRLPAGRSCGLLPVVARGTADQHSLNQLFMDGPRSSSYTFLSCSSSQFDMAINTGNSFLPQGFEHLAGQSLSRLLEASRLGTLRAMREAGLPVNEILLDELSELSLGSLLQFWLYVTACLGIRLGINPYDQPGVEQSKQLIEQLLHDQGRL